MKTKVILITGSSRGLGAHAAYKFAEAGHSVVINYSKSIEEAEKLVNKINKDFPNAVAGSYKANVGNRNEVSLMFDSIYSSFGRCDVLINMAGINKDTSFLEMSDENWNIVLQTILTGTFICSQEFAKRYSGDNGHIINTGSVTAIKGRKNGVNYCSARAGVLNLTRCLALELAPRISVNSVTPGYIETDEVVTRHSLHIKENYTKAVSLIPQGRLGIPEDAFKTLDFLVNNSSYIAGQNISVDGGFLMR